MKENWLWKANKESIDKSHLSNFAKTIKEKYDWQTNNDYSSLWQWSVANINDFWKESWKYFDIISDQNEINDLIYKGDMPETSWFEGTTINYTEHVFRERTAEEIAIIFRNESGINKYYTWSELETQVASVQQFLKINGFKKGDRCVAYLPNIPEALILFLACASMGIIWSSCSPDFGVNSVIDRFAQIKPQILITVDGYRYNGKEFDRTKESEEIRKALTSVDKYIQLDYLKNEEGVWNKLMAEFKSDNIEYTRVPFSHPIWILYSSGTTGIPKAITHSQGGILLEHYKYLLFQNDVHTGEVYFWYSTTGWMMWNFANSALLTGAKVFIYDGSPTFPDFDILWQFTEEYKITHFGTSAPYLVACMKKGINPRSTYKLANLRSIGSTGAPLPPEAFDYVYNNISSNVWLCSMAGGTDVCTAFVGSNIWSPVLKGKIQCRALGVSLYAYNDQGQEVINEVGEMVVTEPMPSMPIYFWNDDQNARYKKSYFEHYPNKWRHGDWITIDENGQVVILGRSDATLNRHGIRIGTSEIYRSLNKISEIEDSIIVNLELEGGNHFMPLFVKMKKGKKLDSNIKLKIKKQLKNDYSPRHVPDEIIEVPDIPYTLSGKKLETPIKKILLGMNPSSAANEEATKNPGAIAYFVTNRSEILKNVKSNLG